MTQTPSRSRHLCWCRAVLFNWLAVPLGFLFLAGCATAPEFTPADTLIWCGLDYSKVKMIGASGFRQPDQIFPGMLSRWNELFMREMMPKLASMAPLVRPDTTAVYARNDQATSAQIVLEDGSYDAVVRPSHLTPSDLAELVRSYRLNSTEGLGLVFIVDRLVKQQETGCIYVVFFDVASREVILSQRICAEAGGAGFRNYWFNPVKQTVSKLPPLFRKANAAHQKATHPTPPPA